MKVDILKRGREVLEVESLAIRELKKRIDNSFKQAVNCIKD